MTAHLSDVLQVLLAVAEAVCKGDKMTFLQNPIKIQKGIVMVSTLHSQWNMSQMIY